LETEFSEIGSRFSQVDRRRTKAEQTIHGFLPQMNADISRQKDPETYALIGVAMEVHQELGNGFLEVVYQDAFERELTERRIPFFREHPIPVLYKGRALGSPYRSDFLCFNSIIVELKAIKALTQFEDLQVIHYLKSTGLNRAMLFNFASPSLEYKRLVHNLRESA
jgi:GxxExxY protein